MSQQNQWQAHPSNASMLGRSHYPNMGADDSSTFVNPLHEGSSQSFSPYAYSPETAIPPPPPGVNSPRVYATEKKHRLSGRSRCAYVARCGARLTGRDSIDGAYLVFQPIPPGLRDQIKQVYSPAQHMTSPLKDKHLRESTDSRHHQREQDVDLQRLQ